MESTLFAIQQHPSSALGAGPLTLSHPLRAELNSDNGGGDADRKGGHLGLFFYL